MIQYKEGQLASLSIALSQVISYYQLNEHRVQLILYSRRTENVLVTLIWWKPEPSWVNVVIGWSFGLVCPEKECPWLWLTFRRTTCESRNLRKSSSESTFIVRPFFPYSDPSVSFGGNVHGWVAVAVLFACGPLSVLCNKARMEFGNQVKDFSRLFPNQLLIDRHTLHELSDFFQTATFFSELYFPGLKSRSSNLHFLYRLSEHEPSVYFHHLLNFFGTKCCFSLN